MSEDAGLKAAQDYVTAIRDDDLRDYGERYLHWYLFEYRSELPARGKVSKLAALQVRTQIRELLRG